MSKIVKYRPPKERVIHKIFMYFLFTIAMSWSQIVVNYFMSYFFGLEYKNLNYSCLFCQPRQKPHDYYSSN